MVAEECDDDDEGVSSPPPKKKRGTKRGEKTATAAGKPEKKAPVKRGKKGASPEPAAVVNLASEDDDDGPAEEEPETSRKRGPTGKGRKRKSPRSRQQQVAAAVSIRPARQASGVIPQASYPAALGYVGNGEPEDLEPSTKRPRQQRSRAATAKKSPLKPKVRNLFVSILCKDPRITLPPTFLVTVFLATYRLQLEQKRRHFLVRTELDLQCTSYVYICVRTLTLYICTLTLYSVNYCQTKRTRVKKQR